ARTADRAREVTIRVALGAGRSQIVRQLLTESALLAAAGGAGGLLLAWWSVDALGAAAPATVPRLQNVRVDVIVLAFSAVMTLLTAAVAGIAPAAAMALTYLNAGLRDGGRETTGSTHGRSALVAAQIAAALVLVVGAALLIRTLTALQRVDLGFETS